MDEIEVNLKGKDTYLYRVVDSRGQTLDCEKYHTESLMR
ncbi:DDE-type integrase/transposase/recombinase [Vacuolonema iberomarrocanum]|nr:DDE-type integrase/transposase/recombinase [filamentous cyanobacterium LEGE 07170]